MSKWIFVFLIGAILGIVGVLGYFVKFNIQPNSIETLSMSYADLAAILLGSSTLLVTTFGIVIAILAFFGKKEIVQKAEEAAQNHVTKQLIETGVLNEMIKDKLSLSLSVIKNDGLGEGADENDEYGQPKDINE